MTKQNKNRKVQATLEEMVQSGSQLILMHDDGTEQLTFCLLFRMAVIFGFEPCFFRLRILAENRGTPMIITG